VAARRATTTLPASAPAPDTHGVLADLASSIRKWLTAELPPGTAVGFEQPIQLAKAQRPPRAGLVNVFQYGIADAPIGMPAARIRMRNDEGRVTGSMAPVHFYHVSYLVTTWAADIEKEQQLLGAVLEAHADEDVLGPDHLCGSLAGQSAGLPVRLGWSPVSGGPDLWGALGVPMRSAVDMTITAPALPSRMRKPAPLVEAAVLDVHDSVQRPLETPQPRWRRTSITEH
jgi:hypothetical protein